ncbi:CPBP family intramembrane glutamic endopeptidase [Flavobacterium aestivum]|uniref:CPBP family intramembrane glutamic endopeptidase n=1 Tax=Flavobacterium aestivum TaxID=3003257 RepID=UPI002482C466|nr:CPBP family intramembrane glutamic endopeptidase [Flavobacterium aestivum]
MDIIRHRLLKINSYLRSISKIKLILLAVLVNTLISFSLGFVADYFFNEEITKGSKDLGSFSNAFYVAVLRAPIVETVLFQFAIIEIIKKKYNSFSCCCISAFFFGLFHDYNFFYFLFGIFSGLVFAYVYIIEKDIKKGILYTTLAHMAYNTVIISLKYLI